MSVPTGARLADLLDLPGRVRFAQTNYRIPSLTAAIARDGSLVSLESVGIANIAKGLATTADVQYRIGSITKTFTAAAVLLLASDGVLDLDDRAEIYLPGAPVGKPTIRQLLAHCGGVQREAETPMWATMRGPDEAGLIESLAHAQMIDRPGVRWAYSNLGYALLGQIVHSVTTETIQQVVEQRLFQPLHLTRTSWQAQAPAATGYRSDPYQDLFHEEPNMDQGAIGVGGQLWSTIGDLLTWGNALIGGTPEVLPNAVVTAMHTLQVLVDTSHWRKGWGLGLILDRRADRIFAGHTGAMPGFLSALVTDRTTGCSRCSIDQCYARLQR